MERSPRGHLGRWGLVGPREKMAQVQDQNFPRAKQVEEVSGVKTGANGNA